MEGSAPTSENRYRSRTFSSYSSQRDVSYSCGSCGYELNLSSSNRVTSMIGTKYGKSIKRGIISFSEIDESRFTFVDEFKCIPLFSRHSKAFFRHRTKLLCRKCGNHVGNASEDKDSGYTLVPISSDSLHENRIRGLKKFDVKIRALQPSNAAQATLLFT